MCMSVRVALNLLSVKVSSYVQTNSLSISEFGLELDLVPVPSYRVVSACVRAGNARLIAVSIPRRRRADETTPSSAPPIHK